MFLIRFRPMLKPWKEAQGYIWDKLGGIDHLSLIVDAYRFDSHEVRYSINLDGKKNSYIRTAIMYYGDYKLVIREIEISGLIHPHTLKFECKFNMFKLGGLIGSIRNKGKGKAEMYLVRSSKSLTDEELRCIVEKVTGLTLDF